MTDRPARLVWLTYIFACIGFVTLIALVGGSFWLFEKTRVSTEHVLQAREERSSLVRLFSTMQDAETGQRGFLLTGEARYLRPYEEAIAQLERRKAALRTAFRAEPDARPLLDDIDKAIQAKLQELASTVALKKEGKSNEALAVVLTDEGREAMDKVRLLVGNLIDRVDHVLGSAIAEQSANAEQTRRFTIVAGILILLAGAGSVATILNYTREVIAARRALELLNAGLESRVQERTADLQRANDEIQRFAYIVSHDLRAPLVNVMGYTSELEAGLESLKTLSEDPDLSKLPAGEAARTAITTDFPESIGFIRSSTVRMDNLIKAILKLSRARFGAGTHRPQRVFPDVNGDRAAPD